MWAFWRTHYALHGNDIGYFVSHVITYPGVMREPIAIFDPLLSLMAAGLQILVRNIPTVFNLLVVLGLVFTGMAGYLFTGTFTRNRASALAGGIVIAFNPFIYRQIAGGYTEYAWWGIVPLTAWLYVKALSGKSPASMAGYAASLLVTFLLSIYCATVFTVFALLAFFHELIRALRGKTHRLKRLLQMQLLAVLCLTPLLLFWAHNLSLLGYKGIPWQKEFSSTTVKEIETMAEQSEPMGMNDLHKFSTWRTLHGSLDAYDLVNLSANWKRKEDFRKSSPEHTIPFLAGVEFAYAESVFGIEWLAPLALVALALSRKELRRSNCAWLSAAVFFLLFAMGPFLIWKGKALTGLPLPYAWLYRWMPGVSRLNIPGRAFLGALLCLAVPAARGAGIPERYLTKAPWMGMLPGLLLFALFALTGYARCTLPVTRITVSPVYSKIAAEKGSFALLELPIRGNFDLRMYSQSIHGKPIYRGVPATFMSESQGMSDVADNLLVRTLEMEIPGISSDGDLDKAVEFLTEQGFRYLLLHADGYDIPGAFESACAVAESCLGLPFYQDNEIRVWRMNQ